MRRGKDLWRPAAMRGEEQNEYSTVDDFENVLSQM